MEVQQSLQGFADEQPLQLVDYIYHQPHTVSARNAHKQTQKMTSKNEYLNTSPFIDQQLRVHWMASALQKSPKFILYNNFKSSYVNYEDPIIKFDSNFQSGNLDFVAKKKQNEYWLYIRPDTNTHTHFQWFFFKVKLFDAPKKLTFVIKNFTKQSMLYSEGLKPYYFVSNSSFEYKQIEQSVTYFEDTDGYYNLKFTFLFKKKNEEVYMASQPPYTYQQLRQFIKTLNCEQFTLTKSILQIKIPYLVFPQKKQCKFVGIVIARQHPGQSVSSWLMQGFIERLNKNNLNEDNIRWIIIPMINVDGVKLGNNRTGVLGHDLNRNWNIEEDKTKLQKLLPQITQTIKLIKCIKNTYRQKVKLFLDFHGHSSQPNVFSYGPPHNNYSQYYYPSKLFPYLINQKNHNFNIHQCSYKIQPSKKRTARSILFYNIGIPFTYTIQCSFGMFHNQPTTINDFLKMGSDIAQTANEFALLITSSLKKDQNILLLKQIQMKYKNNQIQQLEQFDSGSQASEQTPIKQQFQKKIQELVEKQNFKKQKRSATEGRQKKNTKDLKLPLITSESLTKKRHYKIQQCKNKSLRGSINPSEHQEVQTPLNFINQELRYKKIFSGNQMSIKDIHKRLFLLRNSKIGKKILIINPYSN